MVNLSQSQVRIKKVRIQTSLDSFVLGMVYNNITKFPAPGDAEYKYTVNKFKLSAEPKRY